jgi:hypothetical protein
VRIAQQIFSSDGTDFLQATCWLAKKDVPYDGIKLKQGVRQNLCGGA